MQTLETGDDLRLHVHGASAFWQVDQLGRPWLRLEVLHFVSTTDGTVRLTVYGHLKRDQKYYAQALTLPKALVQKWHCSLDQQTEAAGAPTGSFWVVISCYAVCIDCIVCI